MNENRTVQARPAAGTGGQVLDAVHIAHWRERGFAFVSDIVPDDLVATLAEAAAERVPPPGSAESRRFTGFGGNLVFPSDIVEFNELTLHPRLLGAVADLLGTAVSELRLTQSDLWPKYGRSERAAGNLDNSDQRIHVDYPNHTLVHPAEWSRPEAVEMIVYLSDRRACGGGTAVVPREGPDDPAYRWPIVDAPGIAELDYVNDRTAAEAYFAEQRPELADWRQSLYGREIQTDYRPGDVLLYRHDTWHRGTPMVPDTLRLVQNLTYRRADCEWISTLHVGWAWASYRPNRRFVKLIATASLDQRAVLGFPQPGSAYWTEATIAAVAARYGPFGMDMQPYRDALAGG